MQQGRGGLHANAGLPLLAHVSSDKTKERWYSLAPKLAAHPVGLLRAIFIRDIVANMVAFIK